MPHNPFEILGFCGMDGKSEIRIPKSEIPAQVVSFADAAAARRGGSR